MADITYGPSSLSANKNPRPRATLEGMTVPQLERMAEKLRVFDAVPKNGSRNRALKADLVRYLSTDYR